MKIKQFKIMQTLDCYMDENTRYAQSIMEKNERLATTKDKLRLYMIKNEHALAMKTFKTIIKN